MGQADRERTHGKDGCMPKESRRSQRRRQTEQERGTGRHPGRQGRRAGRKKKEGMKTFSINEESPGMLEWLEWKGMEGIKT